MAIRTSGGEIHGILKKFQDADPADFHHALELKERQKSRIEGLGSRSLTWRSNPESMRDELENICMLLFGFVGNGFQLALCNVSWLATGSPSFPCPIPSSSRRGPCCSTEASVVTAVKTRHTRPQARVSWVKRPRTGLKLAPSVRGVCGGK